MTSTTNPVAKTKTPLYAPRVATLAMLSLVACGTLLLLSSWAFAGVVGADSSTPSITEAYGNHFLAPEPEHTVAAKTETVSVLNEWQFTRLHVSKSR